MLLGQLFHTAIRTADLTATTRFYTEVLGMILADRPPIGFPGVWIKPAAPGGDAIFHIYAGDAAREMNIGVVSASFFGFFDAPPVIGRYFTPTP